MYIDGALQYCTEDLSLILLYIACDLNKLKIVSQARSSFLELQYYLKTK